MRNDVLPYERIRNLRIDNNMTQKQLAEIINVAQNTYCQYELGVSRYPLEALIKLALLYNTSIDYLVGLTDDPAPYKRSATKSSP